MIDAIAPAADDKSIFISYDVCDAGMVYVIHLRPATAAPHIDPILPTAYDQCFLAIPLGHTHLIDADLGHLWQRGPRRAQITGVIDGTRAISALTGGHPDITTIIRDMHIPAYLALSV